jgi:sugar/nucleoside kinase (ribokinase family)
MSAAKKQIKRKGILAGGNWIIDQVKIVDTYPREESLANISEQSEGSGGSPFNVLVDLSRAPVDFPLYAAGLVGADATGTLIKKILRESKINASLLKSTPKLATSYTDVMTVQSTGKRTFFHQRGANAAWTGSDIDFTKNKARIFHLGYLLLLDALDAPDKRHGTKAAALLAKARRAGMKTSVDVVSEDSDRFRKIVLPALKHTDYCILNEIEAGNTTGFTVRTPDGGLDTAALRHAAVALLESGSSEVVVVHFPEGAFARTRKGEDCWQSSLKLPKKFIKGAAGAGDAFCAGVLCGLHESWDLSRCLEVGVCMAAASLSDPTCTGGVASIRKAEALKKKYGARPRLDR